ncbi:MAG: tetratricopeptide repeat protein, partial [Rhizobiaceae bacterium]
MKRTLSTWGLALVCSTVLSMQALATTGSNVEAPAPSRTLTGAVLSAQVAEGDNDADAMIAYYRQALTYDTDNLEFEEKLMIALLLDGRFEEALPLAEKLKAVPEAERISRVALAIDAAKKENWSGAETYLKLALQSDLDRLVTGLMTGWVKLGASNVQDGTNSIAALRGPEWYDLFKQIHKALILDAGGDKAGAMAAYEAAANNPDASAAPESWLRMMESYARSQAR